MRVCKERRADWIAPRFHCVSAALRGVAEGCVPNLNPTSVRWTLFVPNHSSTV